MSHSYSNNVVHCVFSTKNRLDLIPEQKQEQLHAYLYGIAKNLSNRDFGPRRYRQSRTHSGCLARCQDALRCTFVI